MKMTQRRPNSKTILVPGAQIREFTPKDLLIERLPGATYPSGVRGHMATDKSTFIMYDPRPADNECEQLISNSPLSLELASARNMLHFNPKNTVIGIVTCGGICPGLNDVIRSLTLTAINTYHVKRVIGFKYGYWGLSAAGRDTAEDLTHARVSRIHHFGGTLLGSSRGPQNPKEMVDTLIMLGVNILFTVGGDGTQKGASSIWEEANRRNANISVFGVPKTIDNDLSFSHRTFGFETAVREAVQAVRAAYAEATSLHYGVGIVKLMGRDSGFIAAQAAVASAQVDICLVPEQPVSKEMLIKLIETRFRRAKHCVIVVAEGFGQDWAQGTGDTDASGNKKLIDIGMVLKRLIEKFFKSQKERFPNGGAKYIDPSYMIRACAANPSDSLFCATLSTLAVHEAMAGATNCIIAMRHNNYILVPIKAAVSLRRVLNLRGILWRMVREITVSLKTYSEAANTINLRRELEMVNATRANILARLAKL